MDGRRPMKRCRVLHGLGAVDAGKFAALYIPCGGEIQCTLWTGEDRNGATIPPEELAGTSGWRGVLGLDSWCCPSHLASRTTT